ncbi:MAG: chromosome segregation protein SMC [Gemmataceae bacterium]
MLKRLEMVGFKSFADKTQFDFSEGITAIVGPNGSGKSNIVDAIRWILGEQSAKSLRGGEMADVIFNGSASRRSLGMAEVTMTFDNRKRRLATDADEVQITRRVYRGGEGEYLLNHQLCRLKDIKDLFLGSGAGTHAYCIIEQGRVDVLLQASTKERRTIFEEAAGISRFKAKKLETLRKLERVEQNLLRLRDILEEVEKQLRSVKLQAAKAQRYQEYEHRLRELRVALGLGEYHQLTLQLDVAVRELEHARQTLHDQAAQVETWEADIRELEETITELDATLHDQEAYVAQARQQIVTSETTLSHERPVVEELSGDAARTNARLRELHVRLDHLQAAAGQSADELAEVERDCQERQHDVQALETDLRAAAARLGELHGQIEADKIAHLDQMRQAARLQNDAVSFKAQVDNLRRERDRLRLKSEQAAEHLASLDVEVQELAAAEEALQRKLGQARQRLTGHRQERDQLRQALDDTTQLVADLKARRSGQVSRIEVLEGLERSHEGLGAGVREVYDLLEQPEPGPWRTVLGMVADFLTVPREHAPLIDVALGEKAQRFLVEDGELLDAALRQRGQPFASRVSFVPIDQLRRAPSANGHVHGASPAWREELGTPAVRLVRCETPALADLPHQLLDGTHIVPDLSTARQLAAHMPERRFVTLQGELLEPDGTLTVGTHHAESGIISRKSELRELRQQVVALDADIAEAEKALIELRDHLDVLDGRIGDCQEEIDVLAEQAADMRSRLHQHRQRRDGLHEEMALNRSEMSGLEEEIARLQQSWQQAQTQAEAAEMEVQRLHARLAQADQESRTLDHQHQQRQQDYTAAKVALAEVEGRLNTLRAKYQQLETERRQRQQEQTEAEAHRLTVQARLRDSQLAMLQASANMALWYVHKEAAERHVIDLTQQRDQLRHQRQQLLERTQAARAAWQNQQNQAQNQALRVNDLSHRRDTLTDRLREDYQLELAALYEQWLAQTPADPDKADAPNTTIDAAQAHEEIAELRKKLNRLGSVNLDSLQELAALEERATTLRSQYDDLTAAQKSLQQIIDKINEDSRKLFSGTLTTIRGHFQELFRKLFGGGMADIILEDESDILESGIEIIARPPGKELRGISLMSGGEKTMTAVALLLAIFRSKPSPFCVLDEVDAALDEANIGRFAAVLRDFLDLTHFIVVTHSKRTMAAADVIYGITMQESGISKRVAVRFEDWAENEPLPTADTPPPSSGFGR